MKESYKTEDLKKHVLEITHNLINQISFDNSIHTWESEKKVISDAVVNHHLIELLAEINPEIFSHYCNSLFSWLVEPKNGYSAHPFTLDSYTRFCYKNNESELQLRNHIANHQLRNGKFTIYTALLPGGGDYFSTLWATKILINYDSLVFEKEINLAIKYLLDDFDIGAQTSSQKGFLLYLLIKFDHLKYKDEILSLSNEIKPFFKEVNFNGDVIEAINQVYLIEDFIELNKILNEDSLNKDIYEKLSILFSLDQEFDFPKVLKKHSSAIPQSPYFQLIARSALIATKFLKSIGEDNLDIDLNSSLHHSYRKIKYTGIEAENNLKHYKNHYQGIEEEFARYDDDLQKMWEKTNSNYDNSIFLMMPFKNDLNFRSLTKHIKETCANLGFKAFRVDDDGRQPYDILWDNIVINMLSCRYGISVYVSESSIDKVADELKFFQNPNVALEYGFMKSRGKKVMVLKDKSSITPSDLQGFLWKPFDIKNPDTSIPTVLNDWLNSIKEEHKLTDDKLNG